MTRLASGQPDSGKWHKRIACVVDFFSDSPAHIAVGTAAPGSGLGGGVSAGLDFSSDSRYRLLTAGGLYTWNGSWVAKAEYKVQPLSYKLRNGRMCLGPFCTQDRFNLDLSAANAYLSAVDFYGIGSKTASTKYIYSQQETQAGLTASFPLLEWLKVLSTVSWRRPVLPYNTSANSVQNNFSPVEAPGLKYQPTFMDYDNSVELHWPAMPGSLENPYEEYVSAGYSSFQSLGAGAFSFGRFSARTDIAPDLTNWLPADVSASAASWLQRRFCRGRGQKELSCDYGTIAFHGRLYVSHVSDKQVVPFYYQPTLGGTDIQGMETLRGYPNYRFRASNAFLTQLEYSHDIWIHIEYRRTKKDCLQSSAHGFKPTENCGHARSEEKDKEVRQIDWGFLGAYAFYDAGNVAQTFQGLSSVLRQDGGVGLKLKLAGTFVAHGYMAMGAGHGVNWGGNLSKIF